MAPARSSFPGSHAAVSREEQKQERRASHARRVEAKGVCASAGTVTFALKRTDRPLLGSLLARVCVYNAELSGRPVSVRFRMVAELDSPLTCPAWERTRARRGTPSGGLGRQWRAHTAKCSSHSQKVCSKSHCSALNVQSLR